MPNFPLNARERYKRNTNNPFISGSIFETKIYRSPELIRKNKIVIKKESRSLKCLYGFPGSPSIIKNENSEPDMKTKVEKRHQRSHDGELKRTPKPKSAEARRFLKKIAQDDIFTEDLQIK